MGGHGLHSAPTRPRQRLEQGQASKAIAGALPIDDTACITVARSVLAALKMMHSEGVVHRDIKPANIVRSVQPADCQEILSTKLIDFGSAIGIDEAIARLGCESTVRHESGRLVRNCPPTTYFQPSQGNK